MSLFGTPIVQSAAGTSAAERVSLREAERKRAQKAEPSRRSGDEVEIHSSQAEDAIRNLKGNAEEETQDDRQEQDHYQPPAPPTDEQPERRHIDVQG
ncbi:MAG TPA: hypothetical protein PL072_03990 [Phycisphaerales bacterium]|nr:hypothetical protein [Phycisphaerales bacterium]